jgi:hypothetical protein
MLNTTYEANLVASTGRKPTAAVWGDCPTDDLFASGGMYFYDDFLNCGNIVASGGIIKGSMGAWSIYAAQGSLLSDGAMEGGVLNITSGTDLDQTTIFSSTGSFRMLTTSTLALNQKLWFEARVALASVTSDASEAFVGLADKQLSSSIPYVNSLFSGADDTLSTTPNLIGFKSRGDTGAGYVVGDWSFVFQLAGGTLVQSIPLKTLITTVLNAAPVASTFYKLGFIFDPNAEAVQITSAGDLQTAGQIARPLIRIFVNGVMAASFLTNLNFNATAAHAFPTGFMGPVIATQQHANQGTLSIDWLRIAQNANS